jgi:hypothetical protein
MLHARLPLGPLLGPGLTLLAKMCMGSLALCTRLSKMRNRDLHSFCWICRDRKRKESTAHLLLECPRWNSQRKHFLGHAVKEIQSNLRKANELPSLQQISDILLGGTSELGMRHPDWYWKRTSNIMYHSDDEDPAGKTQSWADQHLNIRVAAYLQTIWPLRQGVMLGAAAFVDEAVGPAAVKNSINEPTIDTLSARQ